MFALSLPNIAQAESKPKPAAADTASFEALFGHLMQQGNSGNFEGAISTLRQIIAHPRFTELPVEMRAGIFNMLADAMVETNDYAGAYDNLKQAGALSDSVKDADYWILLAQLGNAVHQETESVDALLKVATDFPDAFKTLEDSTISQVLVLAETLDDSQKHKRLLEALHAANYTPESPFKSAESYRQDLFEIYVRDGDTDKAAALAKTFEAPSSLLRLIVDNRYAPYRGDAARMDLRAAEQRRLNRDRERMQAHPRLLEGVNNYVGTLEDNDKAAEGLRILDAALARTTTAGSPAFDDLSEELPRSHNLRADLLKAQGRVDEAETAMVRAREETLKDGKLPVSQTLNLAVFYYKTAKPERALEMVARLKSGRTSPYGLMVAESVRVCAYTQLGDTTRMQAALDYLMARAEDGFGTLKQALLCANKTDTLAALIISRLDDPKTRTATLIGLQSYPVPAFETPFERTLRLREEALIARPDIKAAVARYGIIISVPNAP
ncbi:MAG: hypothetical protein QM667_03365 [Asticcacaulis sp.]